MTACPRRRLADAPNAKVSVVRASAISSHVACDSKINAARSCDTFLTFVEWSRPIKRLDIAPPGKCSYAEMKKPRRWRVAGVFRSP
jgi:hypothetical protein